MDSERIAPTTSLTQAEAVALTEKVLKATDRLIHESDALIDDYASHEAPSAETEIHSSDPDG